MLLQGKVLHQWRFHRAPAKPAVGNRHRMLVARVAYSDFVRGSLSEHISLNFERSIIYLLCSYILHQAERGIGHLNEI